MYKLYYTTTKKNTQKSNKYWLKSWTLDSMRSFVFVAEERDREKKKNRKNNEPSPTYLKKFYSDFKQKY